MSMATFICYVIGFAQNGWIVMETLEYGLWNYCVNNATNDSMYKSSNKRDDDEGDEKECQTIDPSDSPGIVNPPFILTSFNSPIG
jgi:hypothetical protein